MFPSVCVMCLYVEGSVHAPVILTALFTLSCCTKAKLSPILLLYPPRMPNSVISLLIQTELFFFLQSKPTIKLHDLLTCAPRFSECASVSCLPAETAGCLIFSQESDDWCGGGGAWLVVWKAPLGSHYVYLLVAFGTLLRTGGFLLTLEKPRRRRNGNQRDGTRDGGDSFIPGE